MSFRELCKCSGGRENFSPWGKLFFPGRGIIFVFRGEKGWRYNVGRQLEGMLKMFLPSYIKKGHPAEGHPFDIQQLYF